MSDEFCTFVPDDPSCQQAEPAPRPEGGEDRPIPDGGQEAREGMGEGMMEEKEARGMEA